MLGIVAAASAVELDQAALSRVVASAAARVELVTGRALDGIPPLVLTDGATFAARERAAGPAMAPLTPIDEGRVAVWWPADGRMYLLVDHVEKALGPDRVPDALVEPLVRCIVAHELTHALHSQLGAGPPPGAPAAARAAWRVVGEGHATWVAELVCRSTGDVAAAGYLRGGQFVAEGACGGLDASLRPYGTGAAWVAAVHAQGGNDAVWRAVREPPADVATIEAALAPGRRGRDVAVDTLARALLPEGQPSLLGLAESGLAALVAPANIRDDVLAVVEQACIRTSRAAWNRYTQVATFRMPDEKQARSLLAALVDGWRFDGRPVYAERATYLYKGVRRFKAGGDDAFRFFLRTDDDEPPTHQEVWARAGDTFGVIRVVGEGAPEDRLAAGLRELLGTAE
jgi:hypothetical protein